MPKMGESVNEGTIIKWYKKVGDKVHRDEIIFEISTDKVDTEIPSPGTGVITEIKFNEGDTVEVGTVVALLDSNGDRRYPSWSYIKYFPIYFALPLRDKGIKTGLFALKRVF